MQLPAQRSGDDLVHVCGVQVVFGEDIAFDPDFQHRRAAQRFKLDFALFLGTLNRRDRRLAHFLSLGHTARRAAARFRLTPGRVTQLRQRWCRQWRACQGEAGPDRAGRLKRPGRR